MIGLSKMSFLLNNYNNTSESLISIQLISALLWILNNLEKSKKTVMIGQNAVMLKSGLKQIDVMNKVLINYYKSFERIDTTIQVRTNTTEFINNWKKYRQPQTHGRSYDIPPQLIIWLLDNYNSYK